MGVIQKELAWLFINGVVIPVNQCFFFYKQYIAIGDSWLSL